MEETTDFKKELYSMSGCDGKTPAKNGESLGKSSFQHKIEQKRVFNKKFYLLSGFVAKLFFRREMVKVWQPQNGTNHSF